MALVTAPTAEPSDQWTVYIVRCADSSLYTGIAKDLELRLEQHNNGNGAKYTRSRLPVELVYSECSASRSEALKREHQIKQLEREQKKLLIESGQA